MGPSLLHGTSPSGLGFLAAVFRCVAPVNVSGAGDSVPGCDGDTAPLRTRLLSLCLQTPMSLSRGRPGHTRYGRRVPHGAGASRLLFPREKSEPGFCAFTPSRAPCFCGTRDPNPGWRTNLREGRPTDRRCTSGPANGPLSTNGGCFGFHSFARSLSQENQWKSSFSSPLRGVASRVP